MQFVTFFIEYFVTGCFALFWILLVLSKDPFNPTALKTEQVILLTPLIYVLGMLVDLISYYMVHPRRLLSLVYKGEKGNRQKKREDDADDSSTVAREFGLPSATVFIQLHSAELGKGLEIRSSRDRIARGAFANLTALWLVLLLKPQILTTLKIPLGHKSSLLVLLLMVVFSLAMWRRYSSLTRRFKKKAVDTIIWHRRQKDTIRD